MDIMKTAGYRTYFEELKGERYGIIRDRLQGVSRVRYFTDKDIYGDPADDMEFRKISFYLLPTITEAGGSVKPASGRYAIFNYRDKEKLDKQMSYEGAVAVAAVGDCLLATFPVEE